MDLIHCQDPLPLLYHDPSGVTAAHVLKDHGSKVAQFVTTEDGSFGIAKVRTKTDNESVESVCEVELRLMSRLNPCVRYSKSCFVRYSKSIFCFALFEALVHENSQCLSHEEFEQCELTPPPPHPPTSLIRQLTTPSRPCLAQRRPFNSHPMVSSQVDELAKHPYLLPSGLSSCMSWDIMI